MTATSDAPSLRLVIPKGSLEKQTLRLFEDADLAVLRSSDRDYRAQIDDPRVGEVVRLRYFAGLEIEETAAALGVSAPTVKRAWTFARAWLKKELSEEG